MKTIIIIFINIAIIFLNLNLSLIYMVLYSCFFFIVLHKSFNKIMDVFYFISFDNINLLNMWICKKNHQYKEDLRRRRRRWLIIGIAGGLAGRFLRFFLVGKQELNGKDKNEKTKKTV